MLRSSMQTAETLLPGRKPAAISHATTLSMFAGLLLATTLAPDPSTAVELRYAPAVVVGRPLTTFWSP